MILRFRRILLREKRIARMVGRTGKLKENGSLPTFVVEQKYDLTVQDRYRQMYKNLQPSHRVKQQQAALQRCLTYDKHKDGNYYKYSESVPLLQREKNSQCSTTNFFKRSSTLVTF